MESLDFSANDFSDPEGLVHKLFGSLDGDERLAFSEEESEGSGDVLAWVRKEIP